MKYLSRHAKVLLPMLYLCLQAGMAYAQTVPTVTPRWPTGGISQEGLTIGAVMGYICIAALYFFYIIIVLAIIFVLLAAYQYLTSRGNPEGVKGANRNLTFAAVAIVVALIARAFPFVVSTFFNVTLSTSAGC